MVGRYAVDPFSENSSLVGLFGSKNMVGLFAELLILASAVVILVSRGFVGRLLLFAGPLLLGMLCLLQSKSATSILSLAGAIVIVCVIYGVMRLPQALRMLGIVLVPTWAALLFVMAYSLDLQDDILRLFGKSATLTGRTFLWKEGIAYGWDSAIIGHGYAAFWTQGNTPAEHLWYKFGIVNRAGFHFHNLYVQAFVDLGAVGVCLIALLHIRTFFASLFAAALRGMHADTTMSLAFSAMFLIRSFTEVDILGTYSIGPMIFYAILPRSSATGVGARSDRR
jgi:exopolysaccharide production protein ExoQ